MTELVNFSELCDYEEFRISYKEHITAMLREVQRLASPVYLFFSAEHPIRTHIVRVKEDTDEIVLAHTEDMSQVHRIIASGVFVVIDHMHSQIQFHIDGLAQLLEGAKSDYLVAQPEKLYLIQRRVGLRRPIPTEDVACCRIPLSTGELVNLPLLDISNEGLALLDRGCLEELAQGEEIANVRVSLPTGEISCALLISHLFRIYLAKEAKQVHRLGCRITGLDAAGSVALQTYLQRLSPDTVAG